MTARPTAGSRFRELLERERPLLLPGAINPVMAMMARDAGFGTVYLSGSGVATASYGLPDLGMTTLTEVLEDTRRITRALPEMPLIVDADTGFGGELSVERTVRELIAVGAAGCHIEDQEGAKRCGHRPGKRIVPLEEMVARVRVAASARDQSPDPQFFIFARTDAFAQDGLQGAITRSRACIEAGADGIFPEALTSLGDYRALCDALPGVPVLANITEFGKTPLLTAQELGAAGVRIVLYPLTIFRMLLAAARDGYETLRRDGTQQALLPRMMTRDELYQLINYHDYEQRLDARGDCK